MARAIAAGIGIMEFPFDTTDAFWKWVDLCEAGARCLIKHYAP